MFLDYEIYQMHIDAELHDLITDDRNVGRDVDDPIEADLAEDRDDDIPF